MVRLYEYVDDAEKSGLFLRGRSKEGNTTFQVTTQGEQLLRSLQYTPGIGTRRQGPRIPEKLHWALYDIGWVYTNDGDISPAPHSDGELEIGDPHVEFTEEDAQQVASFLKDFEGDATDIDQLADLLSVNTRETPFWELDTSNSDRPGFLCASVEANLNGIDGTEWDVSVKYKKLDHLDVEGVGVNYYIEHTAVTSIKYYHTAKVTSENGLESILTVTHGGYDWHDRKKVEEQRDAIIWSLIDFSEFYDYSLGDPTANIELRTIEIPDYFHHVEKQEMCTLKAQS